MTEETPGFEEKPDVPSGATPDDAEPQAASPSAEEAAAPAGDASQTAGLVAQLDQVRTALNERTADLQRLQAEFQNYRRRVERDRIAVREVAIANLLAAAGIVAGVGDFRQEKGKGSFGQFRLADADDADLKRIISTGGRKAQDAALEKFEAYDDETAELLTWFSGEVVRLGRGKKEAA